MQRRAVEDAGARLPLGDGNGYRAAHGRGRRSADAVGGSNNILRRIRGDFHRAASRVENRVRAYGGIGSAIEIGDNRNGADGGIARACERRADVVQICIARGGDLNAASRGHAAAGAGGKRVVEYQGVRARADGRRPGDAEGEAGQGHLRVRARRNAHPAAGKGNAAVAKPGLNAVFNGLHHHGRSHAHGVADVQRAGKVV